MIDTHAHLDFKEFDKDRESIIRTCNENGVKFIVNIGVDPATSKASLDLAEKYDFIYAAVGCHPHDAKDLTDDNLNELEKLARHPKVVALGEIGLDFYRDFSPRDVQKKVFLRQLDLAEKLDLPVVLHIRKALDEAYDILRQRDNRRGVLHAFPGDETYAAEGVGMGYFIAFGGPLTYPKSIGPGVASSIGTARIVTETDCPYLPPQRFRGRRNQPDYIEHVIEKLAEIFPKYSCRDVERITEYNAARLFKLPLENPAKVVYRIGDSIYINLTMRCTNNCYFCPKNSGYHVAGHNLMLNRDPSEKDILDGIEKFKDYSEIVFCGLGEPALRADLMLSLADRLRQKKVSIRLNTNGHSNIINKTDLPLKMKGLIDTVNVSLNAENADIYSKICQPQFGQKSYDEMLKFAENCKARGINAIFSVVDIPEIDLGECKAIAERLNIPLKVRKYVTV